jgi:hypothetical protein
MTILRLLLAAAFVALSAAALAQDDPSQYSAGDCGGVMRGYDGRGYQCEANRRPVCQLSTGRCVCLLRRDCGGDRDEPW